MDKMHKAGDTELPCPLCISMYSPTFKLSGDYRFGIFMEASPSRYDQLLTYSQSLSPPGRWEAELKVPSVQPADQPPS